MAKTKTTKKQTVDETVDEKEESLLHLISTLTEETARLSGFVKDLNKELENTKLPKKERATIEKKIEEYNKIMEYNEQFVEHLKELTDSNTKTL